MSGYLNHRSVPFSFFLCGQATGPHPYPISSPQDGQYPVTQHPEEQILCTGSAPSGM